MTLRTYLRVAFCLVIFAGIQPVYLRAQNEKALLSENYRTLGLAVEGLGPNAANASLTTESIQTRTESRMRSFGIKPVPVDPPKSAPYLYVQITVVSYAYVISVKFMRFAEWSIPGGQTGTGSVATWSTEIIGGPGGKAADILEALNNEVDDFLNEYVKANQDAKQ